jgi:hypothetical protein
MFSGPPNIVFEPTRPRPTSGASACPTAIVGCARNVPPKRCLTGGFVRDWANSLVISMVYGGEGGIRTPDTVARMPHFECGAFNHSATSPSEAERGDRRPREVRAVLSEGRR